MPRDDAGQAHDRLKTAMRARRASTFHCAPGKGNVLQVRPEFLRLWILSPRVISRTSVIPPKPRTALEMIDERVGDLAHIEKGPLLF